MTFQQALEEANRCLLCHDAPCSVGCPGGTDPAKFIRQIRFLNLKGAARTVLGNNPLGGACAFVCPTEETCVRACLRSGLDRPIDIDGLQAFAADYGRRIGLSPNEPVEPRSEKVAIVGAGPAGLTAAGRLAALGYRVTVFEQRDQAGGMLRYGVPHHRLPEDVLDADIEGILSMSVELKCGAPIEEQNGAQKLLEEGYSAVFVAPGLWNARTLELPGIELQGVTHAVDFLERAHTTPDEIEALCNGQSVAIIGGGSVAMDVATTARLNGAKRVYCISLEGLAELPAAEHELHDALSQGVIFKPQSQVTAILGEDGKVTGVEGTEIEWIEPGKLVPQNARTLEGTRYALRVGLVVQAIGQKATETAGRIIASATMGGRLQTEPGSQATSVAGVYAGGDIVRGAGTVVAAVGDGKRAAAAIHAVLRRGSGKEVG